jgi:predicted small lipoprotein YifL
MIRLLIPVLFALLIAGCGKTGPLYLPDAEHEKDARLAPGKMPVMKQEVKNHG